MKNFKVEITNIPDSFIEGLFKEFKKEAAKQSGYHVTPKYNIQIDFDDLLSLDKLGFKIFTDIVSSAVTMQTAVDAIDNEDLN